MIQLADYSGAYGYQEDWWEETSVPVQAKPDPQLTSILKVKKSFTFEFGGGPYRVEHFKEFVRQIEGLPDGAKVTLNYSRSATDGDYLAFYVNEV